MSLADYLAKKYLTADTSPSGFSGSNKSKKKKSRKNEDHLIIKDDDELDISIQQATKVDAPYKCLTELNRSKLENSNDETDPVVVGYTADFKMNKVNKWKVIEEKNNTHKEDALAEAIVAQANQERLNRDEDKIDEPQIVQVDDEKYNPELMTSGAKAGLQTADQVSEAIKLKKDRQKQDLIALQAANAENNVNINSGAPKHDTIYRDATGRIVNISMLRAQMRNKIEMEEKRKRDELEERGGDVQKEEAAKHRKQLQEAKFMKFARTADDKELNELQKSRDIWNDPASKFSNDNHDLDKLFGTKAKTSEPPTKSPSLPTYKGPWEANRYNVAPGHLWDGVDRSTGFEKRYFAAMNRVARNRILEYSMQTDD